MLRLEPIPSKWGQFRSTIEKLGVEAEQKIQFPVLAPKIRYRYGDSVTRLTTGETLENLEGSVTLYRGQQKREDGQPFPNAIFYVSAFEGTNEIPAASSAFDVQLFLDEMLFDQILAFARSGNPVLMDLNFDHSSGPIKYGNAPDGHEKVWDNLSKENSVANIVGATFDIRLGGPIGNNAENRRGPDHTIDVSPPTFDQYDQRFEAIRVLLTEQRRSLSVLKWSVLVVAAVLILTKLI